MLSEIPTVEELLKAARDEYVRVYGDQPEVAACAPGRVNLIGEHTDYNDGLVFPMALPLLTVLVGKLNGTNQCDISTLSSIEEVKRVTFNVPTPDQKLTPGESHWANYVKGVVANFPGKFGGFNMVVCSSVPLGGGLSSSASLEVGTFTFLEGLTSTTHIKPKDKALLCQKAEHEFAGMPCGIMDQFISAMGKKNHALLIDCRSLKSQLVPITDENVVFLITNSNVKHKLTGSEYPQRRAQCQNAATLLGEPSLRTVPLEELDALRKLQVDEKTINRAEHVISEILRTAEAAEALQGNNFEKIGKLMNESHNSLQHLFEVSCPEVDSLVEIARTVKGVYGSRMTGGGFGGCTVTLVRKDSVDVVVKAISENYKGTPTFYVCSPSDGARLLELE